MFSEVAGAKRSGRVARRTAFVVGSTAAQVIFVALLTVASGRPRASERRDPVVEVRLVRAARPGPLSGGLPGLRAPVAARPRAAAKEPLRAAMIQPKAVPTRLPAPEERLVAATSPDPVASTGGASIREGPAGTPSGAVGGEPGGEGGAAAVEPGPPAPVDFRESMTPPKLLGGPPLEYTPEAIDHRVEGLMIVRCTVTLEGAVHDCRVLRGLPFMDGAVVAVLEGRRYSPATLNGAPLDVHYTFRINLHLPR